MTTDTIRPSVTVSHDERGIPRVELATRQPTRYDVLTYGGSVPANPEPGATTALVNMHAGPGGNVRAVVELAEGIAVLVIDREAFVTWAEQIGHLSDRIRAGY